MSTDGLDGFELVTKGSSKRTKPQLTIYANGGGYLNAPSFDVLGQCLAVRTFVDADSHELAFVGSDADAEHAYALYRETEESGGDFRAQSALKRLGVDVDALEDTHQIRLSVHDDREDVLVGDASQLVEGNSEPEATDESVTEAIKDAAGDEEDSPTISQAKPQSEGTLPEPDHSSTQPDDVPAIEDEAGSTVEKVIAHLDSEIDGDDTLETTCGEIGDAIGEDGRAVPHALKKLEDFNAQKLSKESENGASVWAIAPDGASVADDSGKDGDTEDEDVDETDTDEPPGDKQSKPDPNDVQFWCGRCGQGPFGHESDIDQHHDRNGHAGNPVARALEPREPELLATDVEVDPGDGPLRERILTLLDEETPEYRWFKTADLAIQLDAFGHEVQEVLEELTPDDGFRVERHDNRWCIDPVEGSA